MNDLHSKFVYIMFRLHATRKVKASLCDKLLLIYALIQSMVILEQFDLTLLDIWRSLRGCMDDFQ